jgi:hypothetical protein
MLDPVECPPKAEAQPLALSAAARFLLWDHPRGSLAYDLVVLLLLALLLLVPAGFWGDPMVNWP